MITLDSTQSTALFCIASTGQVWVKSEVRQWLDENLNYDWKTTTYALDRVFIFSCEEHAMAFKLRWL